MPANIIRAISYNLSLLFLGIITPKGGASCKHFPCTISTAEQQLPYINKHPKGINKPPKGINTPPKGINKPPKIRQYRALLFLKDTEIGKMSDTIDLKV